MTPRPRPVPRKRPPSPRIAAKPPAAQDGAGSYGDISIGPIRCVPPTLRECGVEPARVFASVGLDLRHLDDDKARLRFADVGRLLEACVAATGKTHFGLLVGRHFEFGMFGVGGYLMRNESSVGAALRALALNLHLHDRGGAISVGRLDDRRALLSYAVFAPGTPFTGLIDDAAMMIGRRILEMLCGPGWRPLQIHLAHSRPAGSSVYRELFGAPVSFDASLSMISFDARWLDRPIAGADPVLYRLLSGLLLAATGGESRTLSEQLRQTLRNSVLAGTADAAHVAELFSISQRNLRRRLAREGTTLHRLVGEARRVVAQQLLEQTHMTLGEIAESLGYSDPSALSRAFRAWTGVAPSEWRRRKGFDAAVRCDP